jgi:hypothetical protein
VPSSFLNESNRIWLREIEGRSLTVRWGIDREGCDEFTWTCFIEMSGANANRKRVARFICRTLEQDLQELMAALGGEMLGHLF